MFRLVKSLMLVAIIGAALINTVACQDVTFRTKETDKPATIAFTEQSEADVVEAGTEKEDTQANSEEPLVVDEKTTTVSSSPNATTQPKSDDVKTTPEVKVLSTPAPAASTQPTPTPTPTPVPEPVQQKYSVVGPDGQTYTSFNPIYVVCICGQQFSSGSEWQAHHNYYAAFRCACGQSFSGVGGWEAHAGIYDPAAYMYTGKNYGDAAAEGHGLTNESTHSAELTAHGGWRTS